jgi:predicted nucleotidyltransferase
MALFGSIAKNTSSDFSDIDLLVQFSDQIELLNYSDITFHC